MNKIIGIKKAPQHAAEDKRKGYKIILAGGCFDILHIGHLKFLEKAKKLGGKLFILLESDEKVKLLKGKDRPIFNQADRAEVLSKLSDVDVIIKLPPFSEDQDYINLVADISPDIIAVAENDPIISKKRKQAEKLNSRLELIPFVRTLSSSRLAEILSREQL